VARFGTPRDGLVFSLTNSGGTFRWSPDTEIWKGEMGEKPFYFFRTIEEDSRSPSIELMSAV